MNTPSTCPHAVVAGWSPARTVWAWPAFPESAPAKTASRRDTPRPAAWRPGRRRGDRLAATTTRVGPDVCRNVVSLTALPGSGRPSHPVRRIAGGAVQVARAGRGAADEPGPSAAVHSNIRKGLHILHRNWQYIFKLVPLRLYLIMRNM